jgi:hypothetical protein
LYFLPVSFLISSHQKLTFHLELTERRNQNNQQFEAPSTTRSANMCEFWIYGCGHAIRTPCPRPKPVITSKTGSTGSNLSRSNNSSPRRGSSNTTGSTSTDLIPISKFCNGFPTTAKETNAPCYNCILADAKLKIQLERPEVEAKREELRRGSMARTIARGPDGKDVDEFGNKIIAEEEYEQDFGFGGRGRERGFTGGRGNGNGRFGMNGYARSDHGVIGGPDRRNSAGGAFAGNGGLRGARGGGLSNGFGLHRDSYNNGTGNGGRQDGFQDGLGQQRGGDVLNGFGPRRDTNNNQNAGQQDSYGQQHFQNDFGGASWGQSGGLGDGLDSVMFQQNAAQFNSRRF